MARSKILCITDGKVWTAKETRVAHTLEDMQKEAESRAQDSTITDVIILTTKDAIGRHMTNQTRVIPVKGNPDKFNVH